MYTMIFRRNDSGVVCVVMPAPVGRPLFQAAVYDDASGNTDDVMGRSELHMINTATNAVIERIVRQDYKIAPALVEKDERLFPDD